MKNLAKHLSLLIPAALLGATSLHALDDSKESEDEKAIAVWFDGFEANQSFTELLDDAPISFRRTEKPLVLEQKGKAKFQCLDCGKKWSSLNALVRITYAVYGGQKEDFGRIRMEKIYGQQCNRCEGGFVTPVFNEDEVHRIIDKLVSKIREKFFEESVPSSYKEDYQAAHNMQGDHDSKNCEACALGMCQSRSYTHGQFPRSHRSKHFEQRSGGRQHLKIIWEIAIGSHTEDFLPEAYEQQQQALAQQRQKAREAQRQRDLDRQRQQQESLRSRRQAVDRSNNPDTCIVL